MTSARAVYDHSADRYVEAIGAELDPRFEAPLDRSVLSAFAEQIGDLGRPRVLDVGCGPGRAAAFLAERGMPTARRPN